MYTDSNSEHRVHRSRVRLQISKSLTSTRKTPNSSRSYQPTSSSSKNISENMSQTLGSHGWGTYMMWFARFHLCSMQRWLKSMFIHKTLHGYGGHIRSLHIELMERPSSGVQQSSLFIPLSTKTLMTAPFWDWANSSRSPSDSGLMVTSRGLPSYKCPVTYSYQPGMQRKHSCLFKDPQYKCQQTRPQLCIISAGKIGSALSWDYLKPPVPWQETNHTSGCACST